MNVITVPNPLLRQISEPAQVGDKSLKKLARDMAKTMYRTDGVGIAAVQVGVLKRLIVIDCNVESRIRKPTVLVNPEILETDGPELKEREGCLSVPGITVPITRPAFARVQYYDLEGKLQTIEGDGLLGRCLQHEIDHLNGRTLFEAADPMDRMEALRAYKIAQSMGARPGETGE
ncbi:MAG: peptide deformylase [Eggerthellaceae bacterium]